MTRSRRPRGLVAACALWLAACGGSDDIRDGVDPWPPNSQAAPFLADTGTIRPVKVVATSGNVSGAEGLVAGSTVTLTRAAGGIAPTIVLDYGREVGGLPTFVVTSQTGSPTLVAAFSESARTAATGDATSPLTVAMDPDRVSRYPVSAAGTLTSRVVQGGERFEAISLEGEGSVTLSRVSLESLAQAPTSAVRGSFVSSSDTLNRIWTAGAYTVELNRLAARTLPLAWRPSAEGMTVGTSAPGIVQRSGRWGRDYTVSFGMRIDHRSAAWVVRDFNNFSMLQLIVHGADDTDGPPDTLEFAAFNTYGGGMRTVAVLPLPASVAPGTWHAVRTVLRGARVVVTLDGVDVATLDADALGASSLLLAPTGSAGFFNASGSEATYRDLAVTDAAGAILYTNALTGSDALDDFAAGTNALPVLIDGPKRDRTVWSGDVVVSGPTLYASSYQTDAVAGSLALLGSYVRASGQVGTTASPQQPQIAGPAEPYLSSNFYSTQYSLHFVTILHDLWMHTGDTAVLAQHWGKVRGQLAAVRALVDANGLVSLAAGDAQDWLPDFVSPVTGEVTSTNLLYHRALRQAAALAQALGEVATAGAYAAQADALASAINARLYDTGQAFYSLSAGRPSALAQDANALAVLTGVAPPERAASVLASVAARLANDHGRLAFSADSGRPALISPFASDLEVGARFETGDAAGALALVTTLWGPMVGDGPDATGTTWEAMAPDGTPRSAQTSLAHGWSTGPTARLSRHVLGIRPVAAGYARWLVKPQPGGLAWAVGQAPTPHGALGVKWGIDRRGFAMQVTVPAGTSGTVAVPVANPDAVVRVNGKAVATAAGSTQDPSSATGYRYVEGVGPGTWRFAVAAQ